MSKVKTCNLNALKFGTQIGSVRAHLCTKFGWNTVNSRKVICDCSQKITPICYHANRTWHEAENWYRGGLTNESQTFCDLKEIKLKIMKIYQKNQQCVIIMKVD